MVEIFKKQEEQFFTIPQWEQMNDNLVVGFTTKNGGVSRGMFSTLNTGFHVGDEQQLVVQNREIIANKLNFPLSYWVGAEQTHKTRIARVSEVEKGLGSDDYVSALKDTDGLYTNAEGILLTLCFADCVPIYFFAPSKSYIGIAHAGWKGSVAGIAAEMVHKWQAEGIEPSDIYTVIGPSICEECYVVDDKVIREVNKVVEEADEKPYNLISEGQYKLHLKKLNELILRAAGVKHIAVTNLCTSCQEEAFFSYRRDGGKTGRLMSFIGWKEASL
ncbi:peptidoglycan editing factor PgeF [Bacillus massiliigorillae]|uniref:peptidoglycan editing factor PgeF n=1 Tax=Bacillus massiliigorillae TaxID=1243664 RepID=UPI0003A57A0C|nr:peptidoglycan editing factor PgeF [Bacillus massiliigorillae]